jgi:hypothetical protein
MKGIVARYVITLIGLTSLLSGCSQGQAPFRMVQFCLAGAQEIPDFTSLMNEIAQKYRMEFTDRSGQTENELLTLASNNKNVPVNGRAVNIGANHGDDFSFGAGNLGMPVDQIVIGFNGANSDVARSFADDVVSKLNTCWHIHEVAQGHGALPLAKCN